MWTILIEFAFLGLVAFGYYLYQKSKIIRNDKIDIYQTLDEMITDINKFTKKEKSLNSKEEVESFSSKLKEHNENQKFQELVETLSSPPKDLPEIFTDSFPSIIDQVKFHIKKK